ncbi:LysR substrate-binding domain-containing protein, partial [Pseudomonas aeruginosa]
MGQRLSDRTIPATLRSDTGHAEKTPRSLSSLPRPATRPTKENCHDRAYPAHRRRPRIHRVDHVVEWAQAGRGQGLALLPLFIVAEDLMNGRLVDAAPGLRPLDDVIYAMYSRAAAMSPKVKAFIQHLQ